MTGFEHIQNAGRDAVLVVGGGVAGITASLDLADAGQSVHLVENDSHLGGQVSKLDKLSDRSLCLLSPLDRCQKMHGTSFNHCPYPIPCERVGKRKRQLFSCHSERPPLHR